jgi:para-aminobenzoate synthetase/4-amino-4-deoxychorismate lyase
VDVPALFTVERYPNVWQMTSTVEARSSASLCDIFAALHPSASVTGAPKARTMQIASGLEARPRGVYTGAIGFVAPGGDARFSVAIRTAVVDHETRRIQFGVGSGIVWDSNPADEYEECLLKGSILGRRPVAFDLLETLRWTPDGGFWLLDRHLQRLSQSAEYFNFVTSLDEVRRRLTESMECCREPQRVRLLVSESGAVRVEHRPLPTGATAMRVSIAAGPIDPSDPFYFHKTTNRGIYERVQRPEVDDVILWNPDREVTESTVANIVADLGGRRVTPPVRCGLLPGTLRAELLENGEIEEGVITIDELKRASRLWLINSVHGWRQAMLHDNA